MGKTLTSRLPDDMVKEIERIARIEKLDKSSVIRRLLEHILISILELLYLKVFE
jgi:predicted transcriptional regulator